MMTIRQIERLFDAQQFRRLAGELLATRAEALSDLHIALSRAVDAAPSSQ